MKPIEERFQDELSRRPLIGVNEDELPSWIRAGLGKGGLFSGARLVQSIRAGHLDLRGARLRNLHFNRLALENADFTNAILHNVSFDHVHLEGSSFQGAVLDSVSFHHCDLSGSTFEEAHLEYATWEHTKAHNLSLYKTSVHPMWERCDLSGSNLEEITFRGGYLIQSDFSKTSWKNARFLFSNDEGVYLSALNFSEASLNYLDFAECEANKGTGSVRAWLHGTNFQKASLKLVDFNSSDCSHCNFQECNLEGADFLDADLRKSDFSSANLAGSRLSFAQIQGASFQDTELTGAELGNHKKELFEGGVWKERTNFVTVSAVEERRERRSRESMEQFTAASDANLQALAAEENDDLELQLETDNPPQE